MTLTGHEKALCVESYAKCIFAAMVPIFLHLNYRIQDP